MSRLIIKLMIRTWRITAARIKEVRFDNESSLDAITRQLPDGYYSTFRTYDKCTRVIGLSTHLRRLPNINASSLRRHLMHLLDEHFRIPFRSGARQSEMADEARVRVILTFKGDLYVAIEPLVLLSREIYEKGVRVETVSIQRDSPRIKSTAFIEKSDEERKLIRKKGIFEALLVKNNRILEGMTSNFFYIRDGIVYTAQRNILLGVTRRTVIRVARGEGLDVRYESLKLDQLPAVSEAFITSSSRGVVPVVKINAAKVGRGSAGKLTRMLIASYDAYVLSRAERIDQGT